MKYIKLVIKVSIFLTTPIWGSIYVIYGTLKELWDDISEEVEKRL